MIANYIRRIRGTARLRKKGDAVEIAVDDTGTLKFRSPTGGEIAAVDTYNAQTVAGNKTFSGTNTHSGATTISGAASFTGATSGLRAAFRASTEDTYELTAAMSGLVYVGTKTSATQVISLPLPTTAGLRFTFVCGHADSEINVNPGAATYTITGKGIAVAATKDLKNTAASNVVGDSVTLVSDGTDNWWITDMLGTWETT